MQQASNLRLPSFNPRLGVNAMKQAKKKTRKKRDSLDALYRKRDKALERIVELRLIDDDSEELNTALNVLALSHTALTFKFVGG
jgi:hypothetical protein